MEWLWRHFGERLLAWVLALIGPRVGWAVADRILSHHRRLPLACYRCFFPLGLSLVGLASPRLPIHV